MLKKLGTKFILVFTAVLTCAFAVMVAAVQLIAGAYVNGDVRDSIDLLQRDFDAFATEVADEAAYFYSRLNRPENAALLDALGEGKTEQTRRDALTALVETAGLNGNYFVDVGWQGENGFLSVNGFDAPKDEVFAAAADSPNALVFGGYAAGCDRFAVFMTSDVTATTGTFVFYLLEAALSDMYAAADPAGGYSFVMRSDGYVVSHERKEFAGRTLIYENLFALGRRQYQYAKMDGTRKFVVVRDMTELNTHYGFDFYIVGVMDYDYYYGAFTMLTYIFIAVSSVIFAGGIALAVVRSRRISRPLVELNDSIGEVIRTGRRSPKTTKEGDEIYQLEKNYDEMMDRIFALMQKNREDMETQRKLELDTLQMQINPHFLYNTLDAVVWMAKIKKEREIENLVLNLAMFFRLSLHKGDKYITVAEEIEICRHYLEIENVRFPDKAAATFEVDESVAKYKTLKLILQPIVENAMKYAFPAGTGRLDVRVRGEGNDVVYEVTDDGVGFDVTPDLLTLHGGGKSGGYGLYNVNERIKLEYGAAYGITVTSGRGQGTRVVLRIAKKI